MFISCNHLWRLSWWTRDVRNMNFWSRFLLIIQKPMVKS